MKARVLGVDAIAIALIIASLAISGCLVGYKAPIDDGGTTVDTSPFEGKWALRKVLSDSGPAAGISLVVSAAGRNSLDIRATFPDKSTRTAEAKVAAVGGQFFLSSKLKNPAIPDELLAWKVFHVSFNESGSRVVLNALGLVRAEQLVSAGAVAGTVHEGALIGSKSISIQASSEDLRSFVLANLDEFQLAVLEFERRG